MYWDLPSWVELSLYGAEGLLFGYSIRRVIIPYVLSLYAVKPTAWYWHYPLFEGLGVLLNATLSTQYLLFSWERLFLSLFTWLLLTLAFIDVEYLVLPNAIVATLWVLGLFVNGYVGLFISFYNSCLSSVAAYGMLRLLSGLYSWYRGEVVLGRGDVKLFAVFGSWFGWTSLAVILWIASFSGLIWVRVVSYFKKYHYGAVIPFGPFLAFGAWCYLIIIKPLGMGY